METWARALAGRAEARPHAVVREHERGEGPLPLTDEGGARGAGVVQTWTTADAALGYRLEVAGAAGDSSMITGFWWSRHPRARRAARPCTGQGRVALLAGGRARMDRSSNGAQYREGARSVKGPALRRIRAHALTAARIRGAMGTMNIA
jgi:hypothetical protein